MRETILRRSAVPLLCVVIASCGHRAPPPVAVPPPASASAAPTVTGPQAVWRLRAALNVAALACRSDPGIGPGYNRLLKRQREPLAAAYQAETQRFGGAAGQAAFDADMTRTYNHFASPTGAVAFCRAAATTLRSVETVPPERFAALAPAELAGIEQALAARPEPVPRATVAIAAPTPAAASDWRIQLGAFTGQGAAEAAWAKLRLRAPALARFTPHYEAVPRRPELVRLQLGADGGRDAALRLCASAAAAGLDCIPRG